MTQHYTAERVVASRKKKRSRVDHSHHHRSNELSRDPIQNFHINRTLEDQIHDVTLMEENLDMESDGDDDPSQGSIHDSRFG